MRVSFWRLSVCAWNSFLFSPWSNLKLFRGMKYISRTVELFVCVWWFQEQHQIVAAPLQKNLGLQLSENEDKGRFLQNVEKCKKAIKKALGSMVWTKTTADGSANKKVRILRRVGKMSFSAFYSTQKSCEEMMPHLWIKMSSWRLGWL